MSKKQVADIMAAEHCNYLCRMAGRIMRGMTDAHKRFSDTYMINIDEHIASIKATTFESFSASNKDWRISRETFTAMQNAV